MSETSYSTNQNSSEKSRSANQSSSNEKTAVHRNNVHQKECVRQKQRIDDQRRELVRQLSRDEAEMRHLLHELTLDRNAKPVSGSQHDLCNKETEVDDSDPSSIKDAGHSPVMDPYPITFPCRLGAASEAEPIHKKLCRQRALEREGSTVSSSMSPTSGTAPASNPHPKLCRQPSSPSLLASVSNSLKGSVQFQDDSQVWVGDPLAIGSVRRPQKSPTKFRTGQLADYSGGDGSTSSVTSISGVTLKRGQNSSRSINRPQSCAGRLSDAGDDRENALPTSRFDSQALERRSSNEASRSTVRRDSLPQIGNDLLDNGQRQTRSPEARDRPRLGSDPPAKTKRKPLAKMIRQRSMQEILLHRSILSYAEQMRNETGNSSTRIADTKSETASDTKSTVTQKQPSSPRSGTKSRSTSDGPSSEADSKPKRQFQISAKGLARTRHGSLKDRQLKDIQESSKENASQNDGEEISGCRRTRSLKERSKRPQ